MDSKTVGDEEHSDKIFMTSDQLKKRRAFKKMFRGHKKKMNNAISSLGIAKESCYDCCNNYYDEYIQAENLKQRVAVSNDEAKAGGKAVTKKDSYGWVINEVTPFEGGTGVGDVKNLGKDGKAKDNVFCNWSGYYGSYNYQYLHKRADAYVCGCNGRLGEGRSVEGDEIPAGCLDSEQEKIMPLGAFGTTAAEKEYHQHQGYSKHRGHGPKYPKQPPTGNIEVGGGATPDVSYADNVWIETMKNIEIHATNNAK